MISLVEVEIRTGSGSVRKLLLPEGDHITRAIQQDGTWYEADLLAALHERAWPGWAVDVGAWYGTHSVYFAAELGMSVLAIEPQDVAYRALRINLRRVGGASWIACHAAVHETLSRVTACRDPLPSDTGMARVSPGEGLLAMTLDRWCAAIRQGREGISLVKIDAEADSLGVLRSGMATVEERRPLVAIEGAHHEIEPLLGPMGYEASGPYGSTPTWIWTPFN